MLILGVMDLALGITLLVTVAYFTLYSAYDKTCGRLRSSLLIEIFLCTKSLSHSLKELNKVISLVGLTILCLSFFPGLDKELSSSLLGQSMILLWLHFLYSYCTFYSWSLRLMYKDPKRIALMFGLSALALLSMFYFGLTVSFRFIGSIFHSLPVLFLLGASVLHFYLMEIDSKGVLQIRPFAYLPFGLAAVMIVLNFF